MCIIEGKEAERRIYIPMIEIAIVEDEDLYVDQLTEYIDRYSMESGYDINITRFYDGDEITRDYRGDYDIIMMDIQMKFMDGMSAAEKIRELDKEVIILFITNMTQYAIRGYEVDSLDYVLKPVSYFAFSQKLKRAVSRIKKRSSKYITLAVKGGVIRVDLDDIYYVESAGHNLLYHMGNATHLTSGTMKSAEEQLAEYGFSRGNTCYLINLAHVDGIQDKCAVVKGERLQISRPRMNAFRRELTRYWGELK